MMKQVKKYIIECCFLLSFVLPFIKHTATHNGVEQIKIYTGIHFLLNYFYILLPAIACYVVFLYLKKSYLKYLAIVLYGCFIVLGITSGDIEKATLFCTIFIKCFLLSGHSLSDGCLIIETTVNAMMIPPVDIVLGFKG